MSWLKLSTWRPKHLLISWCVYWALLIVGIFAPVVPAILRTFNADFKGDASASFGDGRFAFVIQEAGTSIGTLSIPLTALALAATLPPLIIFGLWLWRTSRAREKVGS